LRMLNDSSVEVRAAALQALGRLGAREATPTLLEMLGRAIEPDGDRPSQRDRVLLALGGIARNGDEEALEALLDALESIELRDPAVRRRSIRALDGLVDGRATAALIDASHDADRDVRRQVVTMLGRLRSPTAVPRLLELLAASDEEIAGEAARALGQIGDARAA